MPERTPSERADFKSVKADSLKNITFALAQTTAALLLILALNYIIFLNNERDWAEPLKDGLLFPLVMILGCLGSCLNLEKKISRLKETDEGYEFVHATKELNFNGIWNQLIFRRVLSGGILSVTFYMLCLSDLLAGALIPTVRNPEDINGFLDLFSHQLNSVSDYFLALTYSVVVGVNEENVVGLLRGLLPAVKRSYNDGSK